MYRWIAWTAVGISTVAITVAVTTLLQGAPSHSQATAVGLVPSSTQSSSLSDVVVNNSSSGGVVSNNQAANNNTISNAPAPTPSPTPSPTPAPTNNTTVTNNAANNTTKPVSNSSTPAPTSNTTTTQPTTQTPTGTTQPTTTTPPATGNVVTITVPSSDTTTKTEISYNVSDAAALQALRDAGSSATVLLSITDGVPTMTISVTKGGQVTQQIVQVATAQQSSVTVTTTGGAKPGEVVILWGTGFTGIYQVNMRIPNNFSGTFTTAQQLSVDNGTGTVSVVGPDGAVSVADLPLGAAQQHEVSQAGTIKAITLTTSSDPNLNGKQVLAVHVQSDRDKKFFWFFPVKISVDSDYNAFSGRLMEEEGVFWFYNWFPWLYS